MSEPLKLNVGSGDVYTLPGFTNIDRKLGGEMYPLSLDGKPVADESVDVLRASHCLEHVSHRKTFDVLKEWVRVLKPGGLLKVAVPDFGFIVTAAAEGNPHGLPLESYTMGGHMDDDDRHGALFTEEKLGGLLEAAGLVDIEPWESEIPDCASLPVSLNLQGRKPASINATAPIEVKPDVPPPAPVEVSMAGVQAILSMPRLCFTDNIACLEAVLTKLRIPVRLRQGVFWGQTMTAAMEAAIADGAEYLLTIDYDSVFTPQDVVRLKHVLDANPDVGVVVATQMGRDRNSVLLTVRDDGTGKNIKQLDARKVAEPLLDVTTAHFGLTMIRVSALQTMAKPWFLHIPNAENGWGEGRIDEDIWFWRQADAAKIRCVQANRVVIGHLQLVVTWPSLTYTNLHQFVGDYRTDGKPQGVFR